MNFIFQFISFFFFACAFAQTSVGIGTTTDTGAGTGTDSGTGGGAVAALAPPMMPRCPTNEVWSRCGPLYGPPPCNPTCDRAIELCTGVCNRAEAQCICQSGYVRHNGQCILPSQCPQRCFDSDSRCSAWASIGECWRNQNWMSFNCRDSCAPECGGNACSDQNRNCGRWAARGECWNNPTYMNWRCRYSCGSCNMYGAGGGVGAGGGGGPAAGGGGVGVGGSGDTAGADVAAPPAPQSDDLPDDTGA